MRGDTLRRRDLIAGIGSAILAKCGFARTFATRPGPAATRPVSLDSGPSQLVLTPGQHGYRLQLWTGRGEAAQLVAASDTPIHIFYGLRSSGPVTEAAFDSAILRDQRLTASATITDTRQNVWQATFSAEPCDSGGFRCEFAYRLLHGSAKDVFFEHGLTPAMPASTDETYVLMPGLLYDGNRLAQPDHPFPQLTAAEGFTVDTPVLTLSTPVAVFQDKRTGLTLMYVTAPATDVHATQDGDMTGFHCELRDQIRIAVTAPCYRETHFHHVRYDVEAPRGASLEQGDGFRLSTAYFVDIYPDRLALFRALAPIRKFVRKPFERNNRLPVSAAASLVQANFNARQWCKEGFYINAMDPDYSIAEKGCAGLIPGWQLQTGWCAGGMTGYALLRMGDPLSQQRARFMLDLIASGGVSPSGLFWSLFANGEWGPAHNGGAYRHMRMPADATFYLLRSLALERSRGLDHPQWQAAAISNLDAFVKLWKTHQDFGHWVDRDTLAILASGSAAGALCMGALALGAKLPRGTEYLEVAKQSAHAFFDRFVVTGAIPGGPLDIPALAPDSESSIALLESFVTLYEVTKDPVHLNYATETAHHLATWIVAYNAPFPPGTICARLGVQTIGGVLANSQNHHIGPSFCTNSGSALLRLYQYTGEPMWLHLLEDVVSGLSQYVVTGTEGVWKRMKPGMVTEQFDMSDELMQRGDAAIVSASWPETCVLLSAAEIPSVYVDHTAKTLGLFDQIAATADWHTGKLHLANPTAFATTVTVQTSAGKSHAITLAAGTSQTLDL